MKNHPFSDYFPNLNPKEIFVQTFETVRELKREYNRLSLLDYIIHVDIPHLKLTYIMETQTAQKAEIKAGNTMQKIREDHAGIPMQEGDLKPFIVLYHYPYILPLYGVLYTDKTPGISFFSFNGLKVTVIESFYFS